MGLSPYSAPAAGWEAPVWALAQPSSMMLLQGSAHFSSEGLRWPQHHGIAHKCQQRPLALVTTTHF